MAVRKGTRKARKPAAKRKQSPRKKAAKKQPSAKQPSAKKQPLAKKKAPAKKKTVAKKKTSPKKNAPTPPKATPARDARKALELKKTISRTLHPLEQGKDVVDAYMRDVDHPFKAEFEAVRGIILGASSKLAERIKWNAPSFYYKEDLGAFNPRATEYAHLILLFPDGAGMDDSSGLLEGNHKDRREAKFHSLDDVKAKKPALEKLVKQWVALRDR